MASREGRVGRWRGEASVLHLFWLLQRGTDWSYKLGHTVQWCHLAAIFVAYMELY